MSYMTIVLKKYAFVRKKKKKSHVSHGVVCVIELV